jgi:hypothetical protein
VGDRQDTDGHGNAVVGSGGSATVTNHHHYYREDAAAPRDAAARRLDDLPLDHLPEPGPLAPGSRLPWQRNPNFVGRDDELLELAATLKAGGATVIGQSAAVTGLGGIGKTQLAVEAAHRFGSYFAGGVFWLSFAEAGGVLAEIATCGQAMGLGTDAPATTALAKVEEVPDSPKLTSQLATTLTAAGADRDAEIAAAVAKLMEVLNGSEQGRSIVQTVTGPGNAVVGSGGSATVTNTFNFR